MPLDESDFIELQRIANALDVPQTIGESMDSIAAYLIIINKTLERIAYALETANSKDTKQEG